MSRGARTATIAWLVTAVYYLTAFQPLLYGVGLAIVLTVILRETGPGITQPARDVARAS
jgi:hypothetical protein